MVLLLAIICGEVVECWISDLSTVSIDSLYSNLKAVMKPVDLKHSKAVLKTLKSCTNKII